MPEFKYIGITNKGKSASGKIVAKNSKEAKEKLQEEGLTPLKLINDKRVLDWNFIMLFISSLNIIE